ncbi:DNA mismatch repair protein [Aspergillus nanangensis]|uniref:DNA mismatch repair protein n=1 Tax=Aspergillus nanangensis TaxID=2582783 RepID=A0AAD4CF26_ASPNN|nr:DNA mismatch repair protein [Aspergillus nanangensis]
MSLRRIEPLPPDVVAKIKSSTSITHLDGVIVELVKNALDANAHTVYVTVDFQRGGCVVEDDGDGIPREEFEPSGALGKEHHTSKFHPRKNVYGRKGLFLASLSSISLLTIASHHVNQASTNAIIFHQATPVARLIPAPAQQQLRFSTHGTSVTVNDLFGNMPVRVKNRALVLQKPDEPDRQWDSLRQLLVSLVIANNGFSKLVLSDAGKDRKLTIRPRSSPLTPHGELDIQRISSVLSQAGLTDLQTADSWDTVSASVADLSIHAAICLMPSPTKKVQFISVGANPLVPRNNANLLYSEINRIFSSSDFGNLGSLPLRASIPQQVSGPGPQPKALTKTINKWPMFFLRINMGDSAVNEDEIPPESEKSIQRIVDLLTTMITAFLAQHDLSPRTARGKEPIPRKLADTDDNTKSDNALERPKSIPGVEETLGRNLRLPSFIRSKPKAPWSFENWSRIKSAKGPFSTESSLPRRNASIYQDDDVSQQRTAESHPVEGPPWPASRISEGSRSRVVGKFNEPTIVNAGNNDDLKVDASTHWTDPYTGRTHLINSRTGQSIDTTIHRTEEHYRRPHSTGSLSSSISKDHIINRPKSAILKNTQNVWVENLLKRWDNPVFSRSEQAINVIGIGANESTSTTDRGYCNVLSDPYGSDTLGLTHFRGKLRKQDLTTIEIIAQVDRKFILAKIRASLESGSALILIDQHAADERCRVEKLFHDLVDSEDCLGRVQTLSLDPIVFHIVGGEASLFERYKQFFGSWGVDYIVKQNTTNRDAAISVHTLPPLVAERCRAEPNLVVDLIRGEIWKREEDGRGPNDKSFVGGFGGMEDGHWVARMNGCPQGIVDQLNSRACRTAVMFNDLLTVNECQSLVQQLSECVFPFQCAHGRPSMVPILDMGSLVDRRPSGNEDGDDLGALGFVEAFKRWSCNL